MSRSPLWTHNIPLTSASSTGELWYLRWESELKCIQILTGISELRWNWTFCVAGIIFSLHYKGILSFISISKEILANKIQLCYILLMVEPPDWVKRRNAFNSPAHPTSTVCRWGLGMQELTILFQIKKNLTELFVSPVFDNIIISFPAFQMPDYFNLTEHGLTEERTITRHVSFPPAYTFDLVLLLLLLDYGNACRLHCTRKHTNKWEKTGMAREPWERVKQQVHAAAWWYGQEWFEHLWVLAWYCLHKILFHFVWLSPLFLVHHWVDRVKGFHSAWDGDTTLSS